MSITAVSPAIDSNARDDHKRQVLTSIVESLPEAHRVAFYRFYSENFHSEQAVEGTGLTPDEFREVRDQVRRKYHAVIGSSLTPEDWLQREQRLQVRLEDIAKRRCVSGTQILEIIRERERLFAGGAH
jgi:hypothetical protein